MSKRSIPAVALARRYVRDHATHADGVTLRRWRGEWYRWQPKRGCYVATSNEQVDSELYRKIGLHTRADVGDVRHALLAVDGVLIDHIELGTLIDDDRDYDARDIAVCVNGLVHLPSGQLRPATPRFFATASLGVAFDSSAPEPTKWLAFLRELWPDDDESISALQEWLGYLLTPDTRQHKILLLVGPPRSGKGTIMRVGTALLGRSNVAAPTLSSLARNFGLQPLIGRTAAIVGDARLGGRTDVTQIVERLLSISGEDSQTIDRKHRDAWSGTLSARFVLMSNELPRFSDASDALAQRMIALRLTRNWLGREDETLTEQLLAELSGVLCWAIEGWRRLRDRRHFVQPRSSASMIGDLIDLASPVAAWVRARLDRDIVDRDRWVTCDDAYQDFQNWCHFEGVKVIPTNTVFGRDVKTITGTDRVLVSRLARGQQRRVNAYMSVALRPDDQGDQGSDHCWPDVESNHPEGNGANPDHPDHPAGRNGHSLQLDLISVPKPDDLGKG